MSFGGMSQSALPTFYQNLKSEILVGTSFDFIICNDLFHCQIILEELFFLFSGPGLHQVLYSCNFLALAKLLRNQFYSNQVISNPKRMSEGIPSLM